MTGMRRVQDWLDDHEPLVALASVCAFFALVFLLGGCGSSSSPYAPKLLRGPASCIPQEGAGTMGDCTPKPVGLGLGPVSVSLRGPFVVDVSYFQGAINWVAARPHISGAIVRVADGNFNDPAFARNWHELRRLHVWHGAYYFLRPGNCTAEADRAVGLVKAQGGFDSGPLIEDAEVPLNAGCAEAFVQRVESDTGLPGVIYTAPGTWPGGGHGHAVLWVASYGPSPGCVWTCSYVAWQFTDGQIGPSPHCTAGIGCDDVSTDNGITSIGRTPPKPKPSPCHASCHRRQLRALYARRNALRTDLTRRRCRVIHGKHAFRLCPYWAREGRVVNRQIRSLGGH